MAKDHNDREAAESDSVLAEFEQAWKDALAGSAPPDLAAFLSKLEPASELRRDLERCDRQYRAQWSARKQSGGEDVAATIDPACDDTVDKAQMGSADDTSFVPPEAEAGATIDPDDAVADSAGAAFDVDATIDPADPAASEIGETAAPHDTDTTGRASTDFSWDPGATGDQESASDESKSIAGYTVLCELGRGGMGVVYRARHRALKRIVALKMILSGGHAGEEQLQRFRAEAEAVALLQHPNIVQIFEVGEHDGLPFCALEFVDGLTLEHEIARQPQESHKAAHLVEQIARGMHYAHQQGIVHRDLKPANILLTRDGLPKITDFGLVKKLDDADSSQTRTGTIMGTPSYMAPEQARGDKSIGPAADVYAMGSILYTCLTGRPPFVAATAMDTLMQVMKEEPVPPSRLQPGIPTDLETICLKCLQKEPEKRYASAEALADDLQCFIEGKPILARPVGLPERVWRWCKRNPRVAVLTGLALALALTLMIGGPITAAIIYGQKQRAVAAEMRATAAKKVAVKNESLARKAEKAAAESYEVARDQRRLALEALNTVVTKVEEELRDRSDLSSLRQDVLQIAMEKLQEVSAESASNAALADRSIGAAHQRMGELLLRAGLTAEAQEQFESAVSIFETLLAADAANDLARWNAALTYNGLGDVSAKRLDDANVSLDYHRKALEYRKTLLDTSKAPQLKKFMIVASLVNSHARLGDLYLEQVGDPEAALQQYQQSLEFAEQLMTLLPDHPVVRQAFAGAQFKLGTVLWRMKKLEEARELFEEAMSVREKLLADNPDSVKAQQDVAVSHWALGDLSLRSGEADKALRHYQAAHKLRLALHAKEPNSPEMQEDLANSHYRLGLAHLAFGSEEDAKQDFARCLELREQVVQLDPENATRQLALVMAEARNGRLEDAAGRLSELRQKLFPNPGTLVRLAAGYAVCAEHAARSKPDSARESMDYLKEAQQLIDEARRRGYVDEESLAGDPDLRYLRDQTSKAGGGDAVADR